ncbi:MAG: MFS transporter [Thermomicrobiales bacterium]
MPRLIPSPTPRVAVSTFFAVTGFIYASWVARIPAAAEKLDLNTGQLGTLLLFVGIGSIVAFQFVGRIIEVRGSGRTAILFGGLYVITLSLLALSPVPFVLGIALFGYGFVFGAVDVAMNAQGVEVERSLHKPIMGSLHGFFSLGSLVGAALSGVIAEAGIGLTPHFIAFSLIGLALLLWAQAGQIADAPSPVGAAEEPKRARFSLPPKVLWPLGVIAFCAAVGEGGMADWSALFINSDLGGSQGVAAFGFTAFSTTMLIGRFAGDRIIGRFGAARVVRWASVIAAFGMLVGIAPGTLLAALVGFAIMGLGLSVVIPVVYSAAGSTPGIPSGRSVAAVATIGYTGFLAGPPLLGHLAQVTSLQFALYVIVVLLAAMLFFAPALRRPHAGETAHAPASADIA